MNSKTDLVGCPSCKGKKTMIGLGNMPMACTSCKGIGWIEIPSKSAEDEFLNAPKESIVYFYTEGTTKPKSDYQVPAKKKGGRPKKIQTTLAV